MDKLTKFLRELRWLKAGEKIRNYFSKTLWACRYDEGIFAVSDLTYLEKGGRIGRASSIIGGFLKLRPVLKIEDGEVTLETKTFGERGAVSYMEKILKKWK